MGGAILLLDLPPAGGSLLSVLLDLGLVLDLRLLTIFLFCLYEEAFMALESVSKDFETSHARCQFEAICSNSATEPKAS